MAIDPRISIMGDRLHYQDEADALFFEAAKWINDFQKKTVGAVYNFSEDKRKEFSRIPTETLIRDPYFLGMGDTVYEGVMEDIIALRKERTERDIHLAIFLEGIGSGKTVKASILMWLLWYDLTMLGDPQAYYGLAPRSVIALMMLSRSEMQARKVTFTEVWNRFQSPFNKDYFPPSPRFNREIRIEANNTCVFAGTSSALSALGYNLFGGIIDEASFLEVVEESKKEKGEVFDAAEMMYYAIYNRMLSRFAKAGRLPGLLCMVTSPRYPDDFVHRKIDEAIKFGVKSGIFWRRRSTWEAKGKSRYQYDNHFYMDTNLTEIITDERLIMMLEQLKDERFPLDLDIEQLQKLAPFYRKAA